jgi:hypothetical protein
LKPLKQILKGLAAGPAISLSKVLVICLLLFVPHLYFSYAVYLQTMMPDLHLRTVGSRLFDAGLSPYFYQWTPGDSFKLFNPNAFLANGLNGVTVTPFYVWLQLPLARLDYCSIKTIWWIVMEGFLLATFILTCLVPKQLPNQLLTITLATVLFLFSRNWWLHIYNGQYYIIFGFTFSLVSYLMVRRNKPLASLWIFPLITLVRPFFALAIIPWLLNNRQKKIEHLLIPVFVCIGLLLLSGSIGMQGDYNKAMKMYSAEIVGVEYPSVGVDHHNDNVRLEACVERVSSFRIFGAGCLLSVQHYLNLFGIKSNSTLLFTGLLLVSVIVLLLIVTPTQISRDAYNLILSSFLIYTLCELFTPAYRNPYNLVQYLGIFGIFVSKASLRLIIMMTVGLALNHDFPIRLSYLREIGEMIMLLSIFIALLKDRARKNVTGSFQL